MPDPRPLARRLLQEIRTRADAVELDLDDFAHAHAVNMMAGDVLDLMNPYDLAQRVAALPRATTMSTLPFPPSDRPAYVGWHRAGPRQPWRPVVEADTSSACWQKLLSCRESGDKCVLPEGGSPRDSRPR